MWLKNVENWLDIIFFIDGFYKVIFRFYHYFVFYNNSSQNSYLLNSSHIVGMDEVCVIKILNNFNHF